MGVEGGIGYWTDSGIGEEEVRDRGVLSIDSGCVCCHSLSLVLFRRRGLADQGWTQ